MKLVLAESSYLKDSISIISDLVNEARFKITKESMELVAMDPANVAMVIFKILSSAFTEYSVQEDLQLAINLANFKQILKRAKQTDIVVLETNGSKLKVQFKGQSTRTFSLPTIELEEKEQKVPSLEFPVSIIAPCNVLNDAVDDATVVAESLAFEAEKQKLTITAEGDLSDVKVEIKGDDSVKISAESKAKSKYSIEYLKKMVGASKLSDTVEINFNKDYPLKLVYKQIDKLSLSFILAPRVEND